MTKYIDLKLTLLEAEAMSHALGNSTSCWDDLLGVMAGQEVDAHAALRAHAKLDNAIRLPAAAASAPGKVWGGTPDGRCRIIVRTKTKKAAMAAFRAHGYTVTEYDWRRSFCESGNEEEEAVTARKAGTVFVADARGPLCWQPLTPVLSLQQCKVPACGKDTRVRCCACGEPVCHRHCKGHDTDAPFCAKCQGVR